MYTEQKISLFGKYLHFVGVLLNILSTYTLTEPMKHLPGFRVTKFSLFRKHYVSTGYFVLSVVTKARLLINVVCIIENIV
jgi:cytochrome b561